MFYWYPKISQAAGSKSARQAKKQRPRRAPKGGETSAADTVDQTLP